MKAFRSAAIALSGLLAIGALFVARPAARAADEMPAVGTTAPNFTLNSQEGKPLSLADYRGKWVVLYFYPKDMSPGCTIEAHAFQSDMDKYQAKNAVIVGVSVDSVESHQQFCAKDGLNFKLVADVDKQVVAQYGSEQTFGANTVAARNTFLIDPKGVIRKVYVKVNPSTHSTDVLADLAQMQAGAAN